MPAFGFQFFHTFRTIESPTTVQFIVIVTFRHDAIPENFPGIVVVKGTDFVLQVSLDPLPAFRGDVLPPVFPAHLVQRYRDDSEKSGIPRAAERRGGYCNAAMVVEVDRQGDIFLQERLKQIKRAGQIRHLRYNPAKLGLTARGIAHDNTHDNAIFMAGCKVMGCRIFMSSMMGNFIKSGKAGKMHMSINDFHSYHLLG